jgi:hypothetical protein
MKLTPLGILEWYGNLSTKVKYVAWTALIVLLIVSVLWLVLKKIFANNQTLPSQEATEIAIKHIEKQEEENKKELLNQTKKITKEETKEQKKRENLKKERQNEFEKFKKQHDDIDSATVVDDVVTIFNKNRSKRKTQKRIAGAKSNNGEIM